MNLFDDDMLDDENIYDAVISLRKTTRLCDVCNKYIKINECQTCDHSKNGYCVLFRVQAEKDALEFNMKSSKKYSG